MLSNDVTTLYSTEEIQGALRKLFKGASASERRVIAVAYIGDDWSAYLPDPGGITVICSPTPGATSADALSELQRLGAEVFFSDRLHMKVYWSEKRGCLVTSSNLSTNAFGVNGLKEIGVFVDADVVDIDKILTEIEPYEVTQKDLKTLKIEGDRARRSMQALWRASLSKRSYLEWFNQDRSVRTPWKLGWWYGGGYISRAATELVKEKYARTSINNYLDCAKGQIKEEDWLLNFNLNGITQVCWLFAQHVVEVEKSDRKAYSKDWPYQAIQVHPIRAFTGAPFNIDRAFRVALRQAIKEYGIEKIEARMNLLPPKQLEERVAELIASQSDDE